MTPRSVRDLVLLAPRPLRKFVRYRVLPKGFAERLGMAIDEGRNPLRPLWSKKRRSVVPTANNRSVKWYAERLWRGFSEDSLAGLERIKLDPRSTPRQVADAAQTLANWYASHGQYDRAHPNVVLARTAEPDRRWTKHVTAIEADCLFAQGLNEQAQVVVDAALEHDPKDACLLLTKANTLAGADGWTDLSREEERLAWINQTFINAGRAPIRRKDATRALTFDNIESVAPPCYLPLEEQPLVSVLVPAHCAEQTLRTTVESILSQSWRNLEVIVVDDMSSDGTFQLAQQLGLEDLRVIASCQPENRGAYAARNEALRRAKGEWITIHDADDWSHPQKIEVQMRYLLEHPTVPAVCSEWVRCRFNLFFRGNARLGARRLNINYSSILLRRETAISLGGWDEVRVGADNEFIRRLERAYRLKRIARTDMGVPLSFALELPTSLTRTKASHVLTLYHGVRRSYHDAGFYWLDTRGEQAHWALPPPAQGRAFPAPHELTREQRPSYDLLVIMDYRMRGGAYVSTLNYVRAAISLGKRVALFHWRRYDLDPTRLPDDEYFELAQQGQVYALPPGGEIDVDTVIVGYPPILKSKIDRPPIMNPKRFTIVTNQMNARLYSGGDIQYDPSQISQNVIDLFGITPTWIPISDLVRQLMVSDGRYDPIHHETWTPLIETTTWFSERVSYRGKAQAQPVLGRHARDHYTKWPEIAENLAAAYCANQNAEVRLLGGAKFPQQLLGSTPANWTVHKYGAINAREFLLGLDFYIHYPHEDYIEEFGRAVLEAMAVGLPVILPPVFEPTFKEAALYAEPHEVWPTIERIWKNEGEWQARSDASIQFVQAHGDWAQLASRLARLNS